MELCTCLRLQATVFLLHFSYLIAASVERYSETSAFSQETQDNQGLTVMDRISIANKHYKVGHEGDIRLTARDWNVYENVRYRRNAVRQRKKVWPRRVIPYEIENGLGSFKKNILAAIEEFHKHTCITFKERENERNWIKFSKDEGCSSYIGRLYWLKGPQKLSLGERCNNKGIIMHELMHAIGFWHEHSRPDRDQYVEIIWENIEKGMEDQFSKYKHSKVDSMSFHYDYDSLMHYGKRTFSRNGKPTVRALNNPYMSLGRSVGFSLLDINKMNTLYDCENEHVTGWSVWSAFTPCNSRCMKYRQRICFSSKSYCPGADTHGIETDRRKCSRNECYAPVDGNWGRWAEWESCDKPCGYGKQRRTRACSDPAPKYGGKKCPGPNMQFRMCNMQPCSKNSDGCNFDEDYCHWINAWSSSPTFKWYRHQSSTPSRNTGPAADHTTGRGHYLYIESSYPARLGYKAQLMSKSFDPTEGRCLSWWYNMKGRTVGSLRVFLINASGARIILWSQSGEQGTDWKQAHRSISTNTPYRIVFEGLRGRGYTGDIALDDIYFREGSCEKRITY